MGVNVLFFAFLGTTSTAQIYKSFVNNLSILNLMTSNPYIKKPGAFNQHLLYHLTLKTNYIIIIKTLKTSMLKKGYILHYPRCLHAKSLE